MKLAVIDPKRCVGCQCCMFACSRRNGNAGLSNSCILVKSSGGFEGHFIVVVCRSCLQAPCAKVCPTNALIQNETGGVRLIETKCIGCKLCQENCIINAVFWNDETNKPLICDQCGYCLNFCPHNVIELRRNQEFKN